MQDRRRYDTGRTRLTRVLWRASASQAGCSSQSFKGSSLADACCSNHAVRRAHVRRNVCDAGEGDGESGREGEGGGSSAPWPYRLARYARIARVHALGCVEGRGHTHTCVLERAQGDVFPHEASPRRVRGRPRGTCLHECPRHLPGRGIGEVARQEAQRPGAPRVRWYDSHAHAPCNRAAKRTAPLLHLPAVQTQVQAAAFAAPEFSALFFRIHDTCVRWVDGFP